MIQQGTTIRGKYRIERLIGRGGMSAVYYATDCYTGQDYAIKDVEQGKQSENPIDMNSIIAEGKMLTKLSNPHLPRIYDIIQEDNSYMVVMDYVEGESLDQIIRRTGPQTQENIYRWCMQICEVFHFLHSQQPPIVYRDMKPANIIIQPNGNVMMIDFGTARTQKVNQVLSSDTVCIGTEGFAAPEQYGGNGQSDARTDIFCLGATIYNMLTGHSPCDKPKGILPLHIWDPELEKSPLNAIILKCTRNDPNERYQTAMELYSDLQKASNRSARGFSRKNKTTEDSASGGFQVQHLKTAESAGLSGLISKSPRSGGLSGLLGRGSGSGGLSGLLGKSALLNRSRNPEISNEKTEAGAAQPDTAQPKKEVSAKEPPKVRYAVPADREVPQKSKTKGSPAGAGAEKKSPPKHPPVKPTPERKEPPMPVTDDSGENSVAIWKGFMLGSAGAALLLLLLSIVFLATGSTSAVVFCLVFAIAAFFITIFSLVGYFKNRTP